MSISNMMFIYKKSLNRFILLRDFCLSPSYGDYFYVAMCLCLISVVDVMFSQQNNNFLLSIAIYIVGVLLIKEIPAHSKSKDALISGVVRC